MHFSLTQRIFLQTFGKVIQPVVLCPHFVVQCCVTDDNPLQSLNFHYANSCAPSCFFSVQKIALINKHKLLLQYCETLRLFTVLVNDEVRRPVLCFLHKQWRKLNSLFIPDFESLFGEAYLFLLLRDECDLPSDTPTFMLKWCACPRCFQL